VERVAELGVNDELFTKILEVGTEQFFNGNPAPDPENLDNTVLKFQNFATSITNFNIEKGVNGSDIEESHKKTNKNVREFMQKTLNKSPESFPGKESIKDKVNKGNIKKTPVLDSKKLLK
jgi:hypothetical protein